MYPTTTTTRASQPDDNKAIDPFITALFQLAPETVMFVVQTSLEAKSDTTTRRILMQNGQLKTLAPRINTATQAWVCHHRDTLTKLHIASQAAYEWGNIIYKKEPCEQLKFLTTTILLLQDTKASLITSPNTNIIPVLYFRARIKQIENTVAMMEHSSNIRKSIIASQLADARTDVQAETKSTSTAKRSKSRLFAHTNTLPVPVAINRSRPTPTVVSLPTLTLLTRTPTHSQS